MIRTTWGTCFDNNCDSDGLVMKANANIDVDNIYYKRWAVLENGYALPPASSLKRF